ncbi:unnamed protein product [Kuraishia capsulata CBS 1993]|uniref:YbgI/family dinuclear metal center protein n=1 Tax=Kuraishia capsulata CBS 1993 TaxID=1382522 RepID=W6MUL1_9ASCO|nr:uncharacterized protein KUCA_T00001695001 [Kuraishia capsulata CBS 1993]CDK25725.1 unnamed protein product [Kuraishia capsulata CBS 1993]
MSLTSYSKLRAAVAAIEKLYPTRLADSSWDNTGLLVDASSKTLTYETLELNILLAIDLTESVVTEAIANRASLVLAYHPFIFKGLKAIGQEDSQQRSLVRLIQNGISVYCPHTAVDAAKDGVNDWLAKGISGDNGAVSVLSPTATSLEGEGMGRLVTFPTPVSLKELVERVKTSLGISQLLVAPASGSSNPVASSVAICAGSGGSLFRGVNADVFYTGELSHHEALHFKEMGSSVIACNHSNTERGYLSVMKEKLAKELQSFDLTIEISKTDKDPFEFW